MINRSQLITLINNSFPDNDSQQITAAIMRSFQTEIANSELNLISDSQILGLGDWTAKAYVQGQTVVKDNYIWKAVVSVTNPSSFITSEWTPISTYIDSTSGLAAYQKIGNTITLDDNKIVPSHPVDTDFTANLTGFYKVESVTVPVGVSQIYPELGKALVTILKRPTQGESLIFFYPIADLTHYYVRKVNGTWQEVNAGIDYTFNDGLIIADTTVTLGGFFTVTTLQGEDPDTSMFSITDAKQIDLEADTININGDVNLPSTTYTPVISTTNILSIDTVTKKISQIAIGDIANAGAGFELDELSNVTIANISPGQTLISDSGTWGNASFTNGLTATPTNIELGGTITKHTFFTPDVDDSRFVVFGDPGNNKRLGLFEVYARADIWFETLGGQPSDPMCRLVMDNAGFSINTNKDLSAGFGYGASLKTSNLTDRRELEFPDKAGTFALLDDVVTYTASNGITKTTNDFKLGGTLTEYTVLGGNQTFLIGDIGNRVESGGIYANYYVGINAETSPVDYTQITMATSEGGSNFNINNIVNGVGQTIRLDSFGIKMSTADYGVLLKTTNITSSDKTFEFPNYSGTIALKSDTIVNLTNYYNPSISLNSTSGGGINLTSNTTLNLYNTGGAGGWYSSGNMSLTTGVNFTVTASGTAQIASTGNATLQSNSDAVNIQAGSTIGLQSGSGGITLNGAGGGITLNGQGGPVAIQSTGGAKYLNDYSASYTNRSLTDKQYVDSKVAYASTSGAYLPLSLTTDTNIEGNNKFLNLGTFDNFAKSVNSYSVYTEGFTLVSEKGYGQYAELYGAPSDSHLDMLLGLTGEYMGSIISPLGISFSTMFPSTASNSIDMTETEILFKNGNLKALSIQQDYRYLYSVNETVNVDFSEDEVSFPTTGAIIVPVGDTSERPGSSTDGMIRFNNQTNKYEGYVTGTGWVDFH